VLVIREGVEVEVEQALAIALPNGGGEKVAQEAGAVVRLGTQGAEEVEAFEGSQVRWSCALL
jgi:hypothetical protein